MSYAYENGRLPSEVYQEFLDHPRDYRLLFGFSQFRAEYEQEMQKQAEQDAKARQNSRARR